MKYCYYCGTELNDDDAFCMNCGKAQDIEGSIESENTESMERFDDSGIGKGKTSHNRNAKTIVTAGVVALCVCALAFVGWLLLSDNSNFENHYDEDYEQSYYDDNYSYENDVDNEYNAEKEAGYANDFSAGEGVFAEASSELEESSDLTYVAHNAIDGSTSTAWVEGVEGDGIGESISITFDNNENEIDAICVRNGYEKSEDIFYKNNRIKEASVEFEDGSIEYFELMDHGYDQIVFFDSPHWGNSIVLTIESVYPGSRYSDTCVSEIGLARGDWAYSSSTTMIYAELLY